MYKIHFIINTGQTQYFKIDLLNNVPDTDRFREYDLDTGVSSFAELSIVVCTRPLQNLNSFWCTITLLVS